MVNFDESPMHVAKLLGWSKSLKADLEARRLVHKFLESHQPLDVMQDMLRIAGKRRTILLELLKRKCWSLDRSEDDIETIFKPTLVFLFDRESNVEVLDLTGFASFAPVHLRFHYLQTEMVQVATHMTHIQSLSILREESSRSFVSGETVFDRDFIETLVQMEKLQMLRIEILEFDFASLAVLCEKLPHLRFLSVNIDRCSHVPTEKQLAKLDRLKVFMFRVEADKERIASLRTLCQMHLPNLQVVENFASVFCCQREYHYAPHREQGRNLRHLNLDFALKRPCEEKLHLAFPNVTHVMISGLNSLPAGDPQLKHLLLFPHVESLHLNLAPPDVVLQFLQKYGPGLHSLFLGNCRGQGDADLTLERIFSMCPRLERIGHDLNDPNQLAVGALHRLKEAWLNSATASNILIAPNLEKITLDKQRVEKSDLRKLSDLAYGKRILRKLTTIVVHLHCSSVEMVDKNYFSAIADLVKSAGDRIPTLTEVRFDMNSYSSYLLLAESVIAGRLINEEYCGVADFFENVTNLDSLNWFVDDVLVLTLRKFRSS